MSTDARPSAGTLPAPQTLADLPPALARRLTAAGQKRRWRRGDVVLQQGSRCAAVVVCAEGKLRASQGTPSGHETLLRFMLSGELMGVPNVLAGSPFPISVVAAGPATTLHIERQHFIELLRGDAEAALAIAVLLSHRVAELFRYIEMSSSHSLRERVLFSLRRVARLHGERDGAGHTRLRLTQGDLAMASGASRQRVHLALQALQLEGRVRLGYGQLTLLDKSLG